MLARCCTQRNAIRLTRSSCTALLQTRRLLQTRTNFETVSIPSGSNGTISLHVYHPTAASSQSGASSTVAVYLPRGPILQDASHDHSNISIMSSMLSCPVVQINYRCGMASPYPMPIHDVLFGYDWIVSNLLPKRAIARAGRSQHVGRMAVCGELIGGQLATMLALSECRMHEPGVVAAAINNPITDWVGLDDPDHASDSSELTLQDMKSHRKKLFRKTEHYHDPFASPALLFRSAGFEVVADEQEPSTSELDDLDELALLEREEYFRERGQLGQINTPRKTLSEAMNLIRKRRSSRRFPNKNLGLRLPRFLISSGNDSIIANQSIELAELLGSSFARQFKDKAVQGRHSIPEGDMDNHAAKEMIDVRRCSGLGLWDLSDAGRARMKAVAEWISRTLAS